MAAITPRLLKVFEANRIHAAHEWEGPGEEPRHFRRRRVVAGDDQDEATGEIAVRARLNVRERNSICRS
jgi:hypothetical protein